LVGILVHLLKERVLDNGPASRAIVICKMARKRPRLSAGAFVTTLSLRGSGY